MISEVAGQDSCKVELFALLGIAVDNMVGDALCKRTDGGKRFFAGTFDETGDFLEVDPTVLGESLHRIEYAVVGCMPLENSHRHTSGSMEEDAFRTILADSRD